MTSPRLGFSILAGGAALAVAATGGLARRRTQSAEAAFPPLGEIIDVDGRAVHALQKGQGPDLVLLHGAGGNLREFAFDLMDRLSERFRVTAFDRPGLGYSELPPESPGAAFSAMAASPQEQARQLRAAAAQLGLTAPLVLGHSYGASVAMAWAVAGCDETSPVNASGLITLGGVLMPWETSLGAFYQVYGSSMGGAVLAPIVSAYATEKMVDDRIATIFAPNPVPGGYRAFIGAELNLRTQTFRQNVRQVNTLLPHVIALAERYAELTLPIEIIQGSADTTVPHQVHSGPFMERYDIGRLTLLDGVGHMPHHADPEACVAAIDRAQARVRTQESPDGPAL